MRGQLGRALFAAGHGYGMGVAVVTDPEKADPLRCRGGAGTIGWPGAYGGWWQADPTDGSVLIFLAHNMVELPQMMRGHRPRRLERDRRLSRAGGLDVVQAPRTRHQGPD